MNKAEFQSLPPNLQRDVRLAVAIGWPMESVRCDCGCTVIFYLGPKASGLKVCINCKKEVKF